MTVIPIVKERSCDGCTKCCEGWLRGSAHGHAFYPGRKCFYVSSKGCSIYESRPNDPCKTYKCAWLTDHSIPEWMKPDQVDVIITNRFANGVNYVELMEAGSKLNVEVLSWFMQKYADGTYNTVFYSINGDLNYVSRDGELEKINGL